MGERRWRNGYGDFVIECRKEMVGGMEKEVDSINCGKGGEG